MSERGTNPLLPDEPFVLAVEEIEAMRKRSECEAMEPPSVEEQAELMLRFLSPRKS